MISTLDFVQHSKPVFADPPNHLATALDRDSLDFLNE